MLVGGLMLSMLDVIRFSVLTGGIVVTVAMLDIIPGGDIGYTSLLGDMVTEDTTMI